MVPHGEQCQLGNDPQLQFVAADETNIGVVVGVEGDNLALGGAGKGGVDALRVVAIIPLCE